jgi:Flp pilus assembly pilin Flp
MTYVSISSWAAGARQLTFRLLELTILSIDHFPDNQWSQRKRAMDSFKRSLSLFVKDRGGQDLIEYALIIAVIALFAAAGIKGCGTVVQNALTGLINNLSSKF